MNILKRILFSSSEVRAARGVLEELNYELEQKETLLFELSMFQTIKKKIDAELRINGDLITDFIRSSNGRTPREWVYAQIGNIAGNLLESGHYHWYRGCLNESGLALQKLFDWANEELVKLGAMEPDYASKQRSILEQNISKIG